MTAQDLQNFRDDLVRHIDAAFSQLISRIPPVEEQPPLDNPVLVTVHEQTTLEPTEKRLVERGTEDWLKAVNYVVLHVDPNRFGTIEKLETKVRFNENDREILKNYAWYRDEMIAGNMSINTITAQNIDLTDLQVFEQLAKVNKKAA